MIGDAWENARWGVRWGLRVAVVFAAIAILSALLRVALLDIDRTALASATAQTLVLYMVAAIVAGSIVGVLRPLSVTWLGAFLVGFVAGVPVALGALLMIVGPGGMTSSVIALGAVMAIGWSGVASSMIWRGHSSARRSGHHLG
jgi:hypothetical protein